jgi:hypothetical protein
MILIFLLIFNAQADITWDHCSMIADQIGSAAGYETFPDECVLLFKSKAETYKTENVEKLPRE